MSRITSPRMLALVLACLIPLATTVLTVAPAEAARLNLHRGSHGARVLLLEKRLHRIHHLVGSAVDGRYRQATVNAVKHFQRRHHLRATGRTNRRTWNLVARASRAAAAKPRPAPAPTGPIPTIVAHRGGAGEAPENTLAAMQRAATSAAVLELDLRLTADHQVVLMHDATLDRTTNCTGRVAEWTFDDLRAQCTVSGQPIPTFDEVAAYAETTSLEVAPEIKSASISDADLDQVLATIDAHDLADRTLVQSFQPAVLQRVHARRPDLRLMLDGTQPVTVAAARAAYATTVAVKLQNLSAAQVASYRKNALAVWTWTATDDAMLDQARRIHADAVITDIPRHAKAHYGG